MERPTLIKGSGTEDSRINFTEFSERREWFDSCGKENIKEYLSRKYPSEEEQKRWGYIGEEIMEKGYGGFDKKNFLWDFFLSWYGTRKQETFLTFHLINVNDLTELVKQINEDNWKEPKMLKKFNIPKNRVEQLENEKRNKAYTIFDNLANQILARCIIVANRLTHGIDKESEENIMNLAFGFQRCGSIPKPKIFNELPSKQSQQKIMSLLKRIEWELSQNIQFGLKWSFIERLQDLPYLNPKYRLQSE